jgi:hypothetical protein
MQNSIAKTTPFYSRQTDQENLTDFEQIEILKSFIKNKPDSEILRNLSLFFRQKDVAHLIFLHEIYQKILSIPGVVIEFGTMYGRNLATLMALRETFEPFNHTRKILAFDTFAGFPNFSGKDKGKNKKYFIKGNYTVGSTAKKDLERLLNNFEKTSHLKHIKRHDLIQGDVEKTLPHYLLKNPETLCALVFLDLDLYRPTKKCLNLILKRMVKGGIIVFDEICNPDHPGETSAFLEVFSSNKTSLQRLPFSGWKTFLTI